MAVYNPSFPPLSPGVRPFGVCWPPVSSPLIGCSAAGGRRWGIEGEWAGGAGRPEFGFFFTKTKRFVWGNANSAL